MAVKRKTVRYFGAHMSVAGGLEKAINLAEKAGCNCLQIFTKNQTGLHFVSA